MAKRWGPWTQGQLNKMRFEIASYFRAYYSELRKHVAVNDPDFRALPLWFKGGRRVQVQACADGVMVVHRPYEENARTFPDREDSYDFFLDPNVLVRDAVARMVPPRLGGEVDIVLLDYQPGQGFGALSYEEPVQLVHQLTDGHELIEEIPWARLDIADLNSLDVWQDKSEARRNAREVLGRYLTL